MRSRAGIESIAAIGLAVVAAVAYLFAGPPDNPAPASTPGPPVTASSNEPAPTDAASAVPTCSPNDVDAVISDWEIGDDVRIATVQLHNIGGGRCEVWRVGQPGLYGNGELLIQGAEGTADEVVESGPGVVLVTRVRVQNYCGPKPAPAVTVAILQEDGFYVATPLSPTDRSGVPPCVDDSVSGSITMDGWEPAEP